MTRALLASSCVLTLGLALTGCTSDPGDSCPDGSNCAAADSADTHTDETDGGETHGAETHGEETGDTDGSLCEVETRDDTFAIGLSKTGAMMTATFVSADPAPPIKGDNTWVLAVTDDSGAMVGDLDIVMVPMMPDHGHGTPIEAIVTPHPDNIGEYTITPVNLFMAGFWEIPLDITRGEDHDVVTFGFCVE